MTDVPYTEEELKKRFADAARDRDLLVSGWRPSAEQLAAAPLLDDWRVCADGEDLLFVGRCTGHPRLPDGVITTSPVVFADLDANWMRTEGRFYRLGKRYTPPPPVPRELGKKPTNNLDVEGLDVDEDDFTPPFLQP